MVSQIEVKTILHLESGEGDSPGSLSKVELSLSIGPELNSSVYLDDAGQPTVEGTRMVTEVITRGLAANVFANDHRIPMPNHLKLIDAILLDGIKAFQKEQTQVVSLESKTTNEQTET